MARPPRNARPDLAKKGGNVRRAPAAADLGFWHRPALLNLVADLVFVIAAGLFALAAWSAVQRMPLFPVNQVHVAAPLRQVSAAALELALRQAVSGNFFTLDIEGTRRAIESVPWVRRVDVRRRWPGTLELHIEEHQAVARWSGGGVADALVNGYGEIFLAGSEQALPEFGGPEGSAARVLARYREFQSGVEVIGARVARVQLSRREAWRIGLADGLTIELGRDQDKHALALRLARFTANYGPLKERLTFAFNTVDMRYPNGFAVRADATRQARSES